MADTPRSRHMRPTMLIVSTFPPKHCGIGAYAREQAAWYERHGWRVYRQAMDQASHADFQINLGTVLGLIRFAVNCLAYRFDRICLHYTDEFMFPNSGRNRAERLLVMVAQWFVFSLLMILWGRRFDLIIHEIDLSGNASRLFSLIRRAVFFWTSHVKLPYGGGEGRFSILLRSPGFGGPRGRCPPRSFHEREV